MTDNTLVVKNTFLEVVDPPLSLARSRSESDIGSWLKERARKAAEDVVDDESSKEEVYHEVQSVTSEEAMYKSCHGEDFSLSSQDTTMMASCTSSQYFYDYVEVTSECSQPYSDWSTAEATSVSSQDCSAAGSATELTVASQSDLPAYSLPLPAAAAAAAIAASTNKKATAVKTGSVGSGASAGSGTFAVPEIAALQQQLQQQQQQQQLEQLQQQQDQDQHLAIGSLSWASPEAHSRGTCRPCLFYHTRAGCLNGASCRFCHRSHVPPRTRRRPCKSERQQCKQLVAALAAALGPDSERFGVASEELARGSPYMRSILQSIGLSRTRRLAGGAAGVGAGTPPPASAGSAAIAEAISAANRNRRPLTNAETQFA